MPKATRPICVCVWLACDGDCGRRVRALLKGQKVQTGGAQKVQAGGAQFLKGSGACLATAGGVAMATAATGGRYLGEASAFGIRVPGYPAFRKNLDWCRGWVGAA